MADENGSDNHSLCPPADLQLVEACLIKKPGAWDILLRRFGRLIAQVVNRTASRRQITLSADDIDDLVAEVLAELINRDAAVLRMFAGRSTLATYLTVIARRVTVHRLMKSRAVPTSDGVVDQPDSQPTPDEATARKDEIEQLLAELSAEDRAILTMHDHDGLSYGEISRATGIPVGSIGPRLSRARATIRAATEKPATEKPATDTTGDEGPADDTATG